MSTIKENVITRKKKNQKNKYNTDKRKKYRFSLCRLSCM